MRVNEGSHCRHTYGVQLSDTSLSSRVLSPCVCLPIVHGYHTNAGARASIPSNVCYVFYTHNVRSVLLGRSAAVSSGRQGSYLDP